MNADDSLILATVANRLRFLRDTWDATITEDAMSVSSSVLRMLLVEGKYGQAWRLAGFKGEPSVKAVDLNLHTGPRGNDVVYAQAGGGTTESGMLGGVVIYRRALSPSEIKARFESWKNQDPERSFSLSEYLNSTSIVHSGQTIPRRVIIKYVANKMGGVHLGEKETKEAAQFGALDHLMTQIDLGDRKSPYFELLSIGQTVRNSYDAGQLIEKAEELGVSTPNAAEQRRQRGLV
jgi:hypothetical protein